MTKESFFWDFINDFSVFTFQISLPSLKEKHFKTFSKSITKNLSLKILTWELNGEELFLVQSNSPELISIA